jgi:hypothetical protein
MNKAADLQYLKTQRGAEIRAGLQGYTGHLSKAELARRMEIYNRIMREMDEEIMEEESYEDQAGFY